VQRIGLGYTLCGCSIWLVVLPRVVVCSVVGALELVLRVVR
jgi:hypothetical protein